MLFFRNALVLIIGCLMMSVMPAHAQSSASPFSVDVISVREDAGLTMSRLDVFTSIPYSYLRFLKRGDAFSASYEVTAEVYEIDSDNKKRRMVENRAWKGDVVAYQFAATQSALNMAQASHAILLRPGRYLLEIRLEDEASEESYAHEQIAEVRDFSGDVSLSNLILVDDFDLRTQSIKPVVSDRVFTTDPSFKVFYELYSDASQGVSVRRQVIRTPNSRGLPFLRWLLRRWQGDEEQGEITYGNNELLELQAGRNPVLLTIPVSGFEPGEYLVRVIVEDETGKVLDSAERAITMEWADEAEYEGRDIDDAIAQLKYIAKPKELRAIREGKTRQERQERFLAFWKKRDPTPGTLENERMQEYYIRIDYANRHYTGNNSGWETDRGHTLVLYGEPDEIASGDASVGFEQPYVVWHYRRIGRQFVFVDRLGNGDFKLMTPRWEERSAIR